MFGFVLPSNANVPRAFKYHLAGLEQTSSALKRSNRAFPVLTFKSFRTSTVNWDSLAMFATVSKGDWVGKGAKH